MTANALTMAAQKRLDAAAKNGGTVTLYAGSYDAPLYLRPIPGQAFVAGVDVVSVGPFSRLKKAHDGPFLVTQEAKDCYFQLPVLGYGKGTGVQVTATGSSSRLTFDRCHFQGLARGVSLEAEGGADISAVVLEKCQFTECDNGFKIAGSNALDPVLFACWFSSCGRAIDLSEGGSNFTVAASGGSYCKEFAVVKAGFQGVLGVTSFEGSGTETFLRIGGDDGGGSGAHTSVVVTANDVRTVKTFADVQCSGDVTLDARKASGVVLLTNKSGKPATLKMSPAAYALKRIVSEGSWTVVPN